MDMEQTYERCKMEYIIKYSPHTRGKEQVVYDTTGDLLLTISEKLESLSGKEAIYDGAGQVIYMVDTIENSDHHKSTIYDSLSREVLTVYLNNSYSGLNLYVSSTDDIYAATHKIDMSAIHLFKHGEVVATIRLKKTLFGTNYSLDIRPHKDEKFIHLFAIVVTKLLEYKIEELDVSAYAY